MERSGPCLSYPLSSLWRNREEIKSRRCRIDCCVIPRGTSAEIANQCTMQYALYRLGTIHILACTHPNKEASAPVASPRSLPPHFLELHIVSHRLLCNSSRNKRRDRQPMHYAICVVQACLAGMDSLMCIASPRSLPPHFLELHISESIPARQACTTHIA
jgi:hypothetical protein